MTQQMKPPISIRSKSTPQQAPPSEPRPRRSVLLADDDADIVDFLKEVLTGAGYETCEAFDGEEAVKLYQARHPDAVLLDVAMPRLDGLAALGRIRRIDPSAKVAMLTGVSTHSVIREAVEAGAADFILKPFDIQTLLTTVEKLAS